MKEAIVIGAGLAGLSCALELEAAGVSTTLLEAGDAPGGRVRTDCGEGFRLDRGFQILLTGYPETQRLLDYSALKLSKFEPGALVWHGGKFHRFADPVRAPFGGLQTLIDPFLPLVDKVQVARLRARVQTGSLADLFTRPEQTTRDYLAAMPFGRKMIDTFFQPFFGGVFLERELVTSSRFFEFLFRMFASGDTVVPADGMEQIPMQLAARLTPGTLHTHARVSGVVREGDTFTVRLQSGDSFRSHRVILAVAGNEGNALLSGVGGWRLPEVQEWNSTTAFYYAAEQAPLLEPILFLNGEGRSAGPINHGAVMSRVSPHYAPPGAHLVVANVVGEAPADPAALTRLEEAVRVQMKQWFGAAVQGWKTLAAYPLPRALPKQRHAEWEQSPVRVAGSGGVYLCGDHRETASIQGALASGRRAADAVVEDRAGVHA